MNRLLTVVFTCNYEQKNLISHSGPLPNVDPSLFCVDAITVGYNIPKFIMNSFACLSSLPTTMKSLSTSDVCVCVSVVTLTFRARSCCARLVRITHHIITRRLFLNDVESDAPFISGMHGVIIVSVLFIRFVHVI